MKRIIWVLVTVLVLILCTAAAADTITSGDGWQYETDNSGYGILRGYTGEETKLVLPVSVDGVTITRIGKNAFEGNVNIREITIPDGYTKIGAYAFRNCTRMDTLRISGTVQEWGTDWGTNAAFAGCINLFEVEFGEGMTSIGTCAFEGCSLLDSVLLPGTMISIGEKAFKNCELLDRADVYGNIGYQAFYNCSFMSVLEIHNAEEIGTSAFQDCTSLQNVVLPDTLKKIGKESFRGCSKLKGIVIPDSVTEVGYRAFYDCKQLKEAVIGEKVNTWGSDWGDCEPFAQNPSLASVTIRSGVQEIPQGAFRNCDSLTSIVFPEGMLTIGENAFEGCDQLAEVVFSDSITAIRRSAFDNCCMLAAYTLPAGLESIGSHAFRYTAPAEVVIPDHVQTIGYECFRECPNLTKVVLGESITKWGTDWGDNGAFKRCPLLATVEIMNGVNSIGPYAFEDCVSLTEIEVPSSSVSVGEGAFKNCKTLKQATVYRGEICESAFEGCVSLESITIRKVTSIGRNAFRNCTSLADAELPRTLLALGGSCFRGTALTSVVIPDSTTEIGPYAFQDCTSLRSVYIGNNINTWRLDWGSSGAFLNCTALEYVFFADDGTVIGNTCLEGCTSLKAVYIPRSILNIPDEILKRASPDVVIYGQAGSAAEDFAASMNLRFETGAFPFSFD